jgi:hypothetical protein
MSSSRPGRNSFLLYLIFLISAVALTTMIVLTDDIRVFIAGIAALVILAAAVLAAGRSWDFKIVIAQAITVAGGASTAAAAYTASSTGSDRFYEVAAQVIPVLLLALTIEIRLTQRSRVARGAEIYSAVLAQAVLGIGELTAFLAMAFDTEDDLTFALTSGALSYGFVAVGVATFLQRIAAIELGADRSTDTRGYL